MVGRIRALLGSLWKTKSATTARENPANPWPQHAIVVVHGIGTQHPREVLKSFTSGMRRVGVSVVNEQIESRSEFGRPLAPEPARVSYQGNVADVYEVYWAPETSRQTTARSVLGWVLKLTFIPGKKLGWGSWKNWYDITFVLLSTFLVSTLVLGALVTLSRLTDFAACPREGHPTANTKILSDAQIKELCPSATVPKAALLTPTVQGVGDFGRNLNHLKDVGSAFWNAIPKNRNSLFDHTAGALVSARGLEVVKDIPLSDLLILGAIVWLAAQVLFRILQLGQTGTWIQRLQAGWIVVWAALLALVAAELSWIAILALPIVLFILALVAVKVFKMRGPRTDAAGEGFSVIGSMEASAVVLGLAVVLVLVQFVDAIFVAFALVISVTLTALRAGASFLTESIGDVQVYTTRNPNSSYFKAREAVLADAEAIFETVADRAYRTVDVIGHSLGAVVAFDSLQRLQSRKPNLLPRIGSIVTLGAALEKVRYFFSQESRDERSGGTTPRSTEVSVRLQDLQDAVALARDKTWLNLWYWNDVVADPIQWFSEDRSDMPRYRWRRVGLPGFPPVLNEARQRLVANISFGWRWRDRVIPIWPHSDYWIDVRVLTVIREAVFEPTVARLGAGTSQRVARVGS